jgi:hypothetical protein
MSHSCSSASALITYLPEKSQPSNPVSAGHMVPDHGGAATPPSDSDSNGKEQVTFFAIEVLSVMRLDEGDQFLFL